MFALVIDGTIQSTTGILPACSRRLSTGEWVCPPDGTWTAEQAQDCGWFEIVEVTRPADTATDTTDLSIEMVDGLPTQVWTARPKTQAEIDAATATATGSDITTKIDTVDLPAMQAILDTPNATINASPASYIKDIAKAMRRADKKIINKLLDGSN